MFAHTESHLWTRGNGANVGLGCPSHPVVCRPVSLCPLCRPKWPLKAKGISARLPQTAAPPPAEPSALRASVSGHASPSALAGASCSVATRGRAHRVGKQKGTPRYSMFCCAHGLAGAPPSSDTSVCPGGCCLVTRRWNGRSPGRRGPCTSRGSWTNPVGTHTPALVFSAAKGA